MKLIVSGQKGRLFNIKFVIFYLLQNHKLEVLIIALGMMWLNLPRQIPEVDQMIVTYFSESRCSGIAGFASIVIGIYVTIWSIFATSASKINAELLKNRVEGQLFLMIGIGLVEAFITMALCVFVPVTIPYYVIMMALFTALTSVSFVKFVVLIMIITKLNIGYIVQEIDEQNTKRTEVLVKLDEIYQRIINFKK